MFLKSLFQIVSEETDDLSLREFLEFLDEVDAARRDDIGLFGVEYASEKLIVVLLLLEIEVLPCEVLEQHVFDDVYERERLHIHYLALNPRVEFLQTVHEATHPFLERDRVVVEVRDDPQHSWRQIGFDFLRLQTAVHELAEQVAVVVELDVELLIFAPVAVVILLAIKVHEGRQHCDIVSALQCPFK